MTEALMALHQAAEDQSDGSAAAATKLCDLYIVLAYVTHGEDLHKPMWENWIHVNTARLLLFLTSLVGGWSL